MWNTKHGCDEEKYVNDPDDDDDDGEDHLAYACSQDIQQADCETLADVPMRRKTMSTTVMMLIISLTHIF